MGLTPFACIPKQNDLHHFVRVVYPDGHIENLSRSCSVYELLQGNPDYYVCGSTAHTITSRMGTHEQLERGFTYFVCAEPNAQPFLKFHAKTTTGWRVTSRLETRSPTHGHGNSKVFDFHSATMQVEGMQRVGLQPRVHPARHLKLVFFRQCLHSLRLPRNGFGEAHMEPPSMEETVPSPPLDVDLVDALLKSAAREELGLYVSRRQEFYLRRARKRRKAPWTPVLQSISETTPVVEFLVTLQPEPSESQRFSPPRPAKNISPPRQQQPQAPRAPPRNISPPRQVHLTRNSSAPRQQQQAQRKPNNQRALYMA